MKITSTFALRF